MNTKALKIKGIYIAGIHSQQVGIRHTSIRDKHLLMGK